MRPYSPRDPHDTPAVVLDKLMRSAGVEMDWRAIAAKQAIAETLASLTSLLRGLVVCDSRGEAVEVSRSELQLLRLVPAILTESVTLSHRERIAQAVRDLSLGHQINLLPLIDAAIADLQQLQAWAPQIQEGDHDGPSV